MIIFIPALVLPASAPLSVSMAPADPEPAGAGLVHVTDVEYVAVALTILSPSNISTLVPNNWSTIVKLLLNEATPLEDPPIFIENPVINN